jgi:hypothetical protein
MDGKKTAMPWMCQGEESELDELTRRSGYAPEDILEQTFQEIVREHLSVLGLAYRIEGRDVQDDDWFRLLKLTFNVIECASHTPPTSPGQSVYIDTMPGPPDAAGAITTSRPVHPPYWIPKADLAALWALERALDKLAVGVRH